MRPPRAQPADPMSHQFVGLLDKPAQSSRSQSAIGFLERAAIAHRGTIMMIATISDLYVAMESFSSLV